MGGASLTYLPIMDTRWVVRGLGHVHDHSWMEGRGNNLQIQISLLHAANPFLRSRRPVSGPSMV